MVETVSHVAASSLGLDTSAEAVPYVAGWGQDDALAAVERAATLVDSLAGWLERAAAGDEGVTHPNDLDSARRTAPRPRSARRRSGSG